MAKKETMAIDRIEETCSIKKRDALNWVLMINKKTFFENGEIEHSEKQDGFYTKLKQVIDAYIETRAKQGFMSGENLDILRIERILSEIKAEVLEILAEKTP